MSLGGRTESSPRYDPWQVTGAEIVGITNESPGVRTYDLKLTDPEREKSFRYRPGQFNMLYVPGVGEAAISISGRTDSGILRHTIRRVGAVTTALANSDAGCSLGIRGPFGVPWPLSQWESDDGRPQHLIVIAGGIGLAPLRSVIDDAIRRPDRPERIDVLIGSRTPRDLLYAREYQNWAQSGIHVDTTVDRAGSDWRGQIGVVTLLLDRLRVPAPQRTMLLTCGPEVMMRYVVQSANSRGIANSSIWVALERNMNCAIGLCGHCQFGPEFVCKDGAIFRYDRVVRWLQVQGL